MTTTGAPTAAASSTLRLTLVLRSLPKTRLVSSRKGPWRALTGWSHLAASRLISTGSWVALSVVTISSTPS